VICHFLSRLASACGCQISQTITREQYKGQRGKPHAPLDSAAGGFYTGDMGIAEIRREYTLSSMRRRDLAGDPVDQFKRWFDDAAGHRAGGRLRKFCIRLYKSLWMLTGSETGDVTAATLATADRNGIPSARVVLLKGVDERGFIFFTNYESRKGREIDQNPNAALVFYWPELERQVCIAGPVTRLAREESEAYFKSRPKGSRLAAWASQQSQVVPTRTVLEERWQQLHAQYPGDEVPMPPFWGGYLLSPQRMEFWQGRPSRLHDRFCYTREADSRWQLDRLFP
jgi:pyridoxamine 5'-phosphate oxidase